jgi:transposase InsO family protein
MSGILRAAFALVRDLLRPRHALVLENAFLRKQVEILARRRGERAIRTSAGERAWLVLLSSVVSDWRSSLSVVEPETLLRWHRRGFAAYWTWKSRSPSSVRTRRAVLHALVHRLALENPLWGSRRIAGELRNLGLAISRRTVQRLLRVLGRRGRAPRRQSWRTFLRNHLNQTWAADLFTVTTLSFQRLHVFVLMKLDTREVLRWAVTDHPTQEWTAQQLREATAWCRGPRFLVRDRDDKLGTRFDAVARACGTRVLLTPPRTPTANAFVERLIGSARREALDHLIVFDRRSLERILGEYFDGYYNAARPHQGLGQEIPAEIGRARARAPTGGARIVGRPVLGGLHHHYCVA